MSKTTKESFSKLSKAFTNDILRDNAKKWIIPAKWILQMILVWPDSNTAWIIGANYLIFINIIIIETLQAYFVVINRSDLGVAVVALATVTTTFEGLVRFYIIVFKKSQFNDILCKIWTQFWPLSILTRNSFKKNMAKKCHTIVILVIACYGPAVLCNTVITLSPYFSREQILKSSYPFPWNSTYTYELIYIWQYFTQWYLLILVNTFDLFVLPLIMICVVQFMILQDVFQNIFSTKSQQQRLILFGEIISNEAMIKKCLEQQVMLIKICDQLEDIFNLALLLQFVSSTLALCSSTVVLKVDPNKFLEMLTFAIAHMFQLFNYCYVGNELIVQSGNIADAIYKCNWEFLNDKKFKMALTFIIERCQKEQRLTAAGIADLDFISYIKVLRVAFSFYTVLDHLFKKN